MEELLTSRGVMAVRHRGHESPAVVAEMLDGLLPSDVSLVGHEDEEHEDEDADDDCDGEALETSSLRALQRVGGPRDAHGPAWWGVRLKGFVAELRAHRTVSVADLGDGQA